MTGEDRTTPRPDDVCHYEYIGHGICGLAAEYHPSVGSHEFSPAFAEACGWDTRRGDGPIGGPCVLPPMHDEPHRSQP